MICPRSEKLDKIFFKSQSVLQHSGVESFRIDKNGVFKINKNQKKKSGARITEYGDEKIILEGDCFKAATAASPFYPGTFESFRVENLSGIHSLLCC